MCVEIKYVRQRERESTRYYCNIIQLVHRVRKKSYKKIYEGCLWEEKLIARPRREFAESQNLCISLQEKFVAFILYQRKRERERKDQSWKKNLQSGVTHERREQFGIAGVAVDTEDVNQDDRENSNHQEPAPTGRPGHTLLAVLQLVSRLFFHQSK